MYRFITDQKWDIRILRHIFLFFVMVILFSWVAYSRSEDGTGFYSAFVMVFINALVFFGYAYLTVYLLIPQMLARRKISVFVVLFIISGVILSLLKFTLSDFVFYQAIAPENGSVQTSLSLKAILVNTKDMTFIVAVFAIVKYARDHYLLESNIREIQQKGMEAELKLLAHQMDPHVIFNNFNGLYSISLYRPEHLKDTVKKLRTNLNYLFQRSKQDKVLLSEEIAMIENYIGLEKLRYGDRLDISYSMEGKPGGLEIAPLIIYPFVENCFVHGAGEDPHRSWIRIEISVNDNNLRFYAANSVTDYGKPDRPREKDSGNENSIRRLAIQYPNNHRLTIKDRQREHIVELNIGLKP